MPNVTTYIRKDDMELWLACPNKAELIHKALHDISVSPSPIIIKTPEEAKKALDYAVRGDTAAANVMGVKLCKIHGTPLDSRGRCLQKGCKYA